MRYTEKDLKTKYDNFTDYLSSIIELLILSPFRLINEISKKIRKELRFLTSFKVGRNSYKTK
jgi:hypothetical protein